jgi:HSP20 family protein
MTSLVRNGQENAVARQSGSWSPLQSLFGFDPFQGMMRNWDYGFEVTRTESGYVVEVPVPGFNSSSIDMTLKDGIISVNGKTDRRAFSRAFNVPEDVDPDKINATVVDGMLSITLERHPAAQPKKISVS